MLRTRPVGERYIAGGKVAGVVVALAATGLLAACGGNDSTASSTPSLKPSGTTAAAPTKSAEAQPPAPESTPEQAPETTTADEHPEPAPSSAGNAPLSDKDKAYLDELNKRGVTPSSPDIALTAANYICQSKASGASDQEVKTFVNAMAGTDPGYDPQKMPVDQAGQIYIDVATQTYCNK
ncbi:DUF732 domain-containing protein [Nocardia sp. NPDC052254]|uniref:DUF732 domain-containing protein n=1 Tax=Nocardia sp. NPDC052254 TaxID=3155681 RepID=UPI0034417978